MRRIVLGAVLLLAAVLAFLGRDAFMPRPEEPVVAGRAPRDPRDVPTGGPTGLQGRVAQGEAPPEPDTEASAAEAPAATGEETGRGEDLVLVGASTDREVYEIGEPVWVHRVFENPSRRPIPMGAREWRLRVHGEVGLSWQRGSKLYEPSSHHLPELLVAPQERIENDVAVEIPSAGTWTIEVPPEYQARGTARRSFRLQVTVVDRGDPRSLAAKAERLGRVIAREDPACPTCWSEAQKDLEGLGAAATPHLRRWLRESDVAYLRAVAAKILGPLVRKGQEGFEDLVAGLDDADPAVRTMCVAAVGAMPERARLDALLPRLRDTDNGVRVAAVDAVATSDDARSAPALVEALQDEDAYVRLSAAHALATSKGSAAGIRVLLAALETDPANDGFVVVDALEALTGRSFGTAGMPAGHSGSDRIDEAIRTNKAVAKRWLAWWEDEGRARYGD